jgi:membrane protease subunit HflK
MPWNQPGSGGDDRDPWGQNDGRKGNGRGSRDGPPDIDEVLRDAKNRIDSMFGGRRGGGGRGGRSSGGGGDGLSGGAIAILLLVGLGAWGFSGFYTVEQGEQAIELKYGAYSETKGAGLRWHIPSPFERVEVVNTTNINSVFVGYREAARGKRSEPVEALMLTQDENIVDIQFAVQYDIKDPRDLLFNVSEYNPRDIAESVVRGATESAVREIVGRNSMDFAITDGRQQLASETKVLVQEILDRYKTGINIRAVEMQDAQPPAQVKDAFDDAVKAREDEQRLKNLAEAYSNDVIPRARGFAARITQEAEAYKASVIAQATGEASRFTQVLDEYTKAPEITRDRLYLESMEQVLSRSSKVVIDQQAGNSLMYLPLDQLINKRVNQTGSVGSNSSSNANSSTSVFGSSNQGLRSSSRNVDRTGRN